ncbi:MAG: Holliday junction resolvase RuvX [Rickettsiales bacterium]|jgi:putative Holliday junction resolvase|nr:Holliday junction resolvase RuvX [Rickettsiales bacterium]
MSGEFKRYLGIDYGAARVGVAISDFDGRQAFPAKTLPAAVAVKEIARLAREENIGLIVVGLPLEMSGREGETAAAARKFGEKLAAESGLEVEFYDERLTSSGAEKLLIRELDMSRAKRRERLDSAAAATILQGWLDKKNY